MLKMVKGIKKRDFESFTKEMWRKLKEGEKKYGTKFKTNNLVKEMKGEGVDMANYILMLYLQAKQYGDIHKKLDIINNADKIVYHKNGKRYVLNNKIKNTNKSERRFKNKRNG